MKNRNHNGYCLINPRVAKELRMETWYALRKDLNTILINEKRGVEMPQIGAHFYEFHEVNYGATNRGVMVVITGLAPGVNNSCRYRLGNAYNPHNLDINWYLGHINTFYTELGSSVANYLENNNVNWANINWPNATHANIHNIGYHAIREDQF